MNTRLSAEIAVPRWNPYVNDRRETHLEFTVWYVAADGENRWLNGMINWGNYGEAETLMEKVLSLQTAFVRQQWFRVEVCVPNRDNYGNLRSGFVKDTGMLLATRQVFH